MQFSLRTFLIGICIAGVTLGVLGHLFRQNPELFMVVVLVLTTIVPFFAATFTLLWLSRRLRSRSLAVWGVLLMLTPLVGGAIVAGLQWYAGPSRPNLALQSNAQLLQQLPNQIDTPMPWQELERRLKAKSLSSQEVDEAVTALVRHMTTKNPQGWKQPLYWQPPFLQAAAQRKMVSEPVLIRLCDAFFGPQPTLAALPRLREGATELPISVEYGNPFASHSRFGVALAWHVSRVLLDGKPVPLRDGFASDEQWYGLCDIALVTGDHTLAVELECAYIDEEKLAGLRPNECPPANWPQTRKRWTQTVSVPHFTVHPSDFPFVKLTSDARLDPGSDGGVQVQRIVATKVAGKQKLRLKLAYHKNLPVSISYDVALSFPGQMVPCGVLWVMQTETGSSSNGGQMECELDTLDPAITTVDLVLTPNPRAIEQNSEVSEIWGQATTLRNVPLERLDLESEKPAP